VSGELDVAARLYSQVADGPGQRAGARSASGTPIRRWKPSVYEIAHRRLNRKQ
jgi:hypothetical protein